MLEALLKKSPDSPQGWQLLGEVQSTQALMARDQGRADEFIERINHAAAAYAQAVRRSPENAPLHHAAAVVFDLAGKSKDALALYQRASDLEPQNTQFLLYLAQAMTRAEEYTKATATLARLLKIDPSEAWGYACLAEIDLAEKHTSMALDHIRKAREIDPDQKAFRITEAKVLRRSGKPRDALELLLALPEAETVAEAPTFELATSYEMIGRPDKAAEAWERCYRSNPSGWRAACEAAEAFIRAKRLPEAKVWADIARTQAPSEPRVAGLEKLLAQANSAANAGSP